MGPLYSDVVIRAPRHLVWEALADLEAVRRWNPGIAEAEYVPGSRTGVGASRRCRMAPGGWITETVTEWHTGRRIALSIEKASPLRSGVARFELADDPAGTRLRATLEYEVRFGPLGPVIDRLVVHRQLATAWDCAIDGLLAYVEHRTPPVPSTRPAGPDSQT